MPQTVAVSQGAIEYTWPTTITATDGDDITGDTVAVSLGTYTAPGAWQAPDTITHPTPSSVVVQILVGAATPTGSYYLWVKVSDSPEVVPRRAAKITVT